MRDFKVTFIADSGFDINIRNGYADYVDRENQTEDQRAAIGAIIIKGTIPAEPNFGVDWSRLYDKEESYVDIYNDICQVINTVAGGTGESGQGYIPLFEPDESGKINVKVLKGGIK